MDASTLLAFATLGATVGGLAVAVVTLWLRLREIERRDHQLDELMNSLRRIATAGEAAATTQTAQLATVRQYGLARQSVQSQALQLQEQQAAHRRTMDWIGAVVNAYDTYRRHHPAEEEDD